MSAPRRSFISRYGVAVVAVVLALGLRLLPGMGKGAGSLFFFAVLLSAWYGGLRPGLLTTGLIGALGLFFAFASRNPPEPRQALALSAVLFTLAGIGISVMMGALYSARTRLERVNLELRESELRLMEAARRKDEFMAVLAHELRNPLGAIDGAIHLIRNPEEPSDVRWGQEVITRQVGLLARLIEDLLDVSRIARGKLELRKEAIEVGPLLSRSVETVRHVIEQREHALTVSIDPTLPAVEGDVTRLEQVMMNLLVNAAKYTERGGKIKVTARRVGSEVVLSVQDNGIGIEPDMLPHIFEMFTQIGGSQDHAQGGLGIGLTLVKNLVELHGGGVAAISGGEGKGSEFTVRLPAAKALPAPPAPKIPVPHHYVRPMSILIVDDCRDTARGLARLLKKDGHEVEIAIDGFDAMNAIRAIQPDVVLTDIGLPGMDGYQLARRLRDEMGACLPTLISISGYGEDTEGGSRKALFDHSLVKPVDLAALRSILAGLDPHSSHEHQLLGQL